MQVTEVKTRGSNPLCSFALHGLKFDRHKNFNIEPQEVFQMSVTEVEETKDVSWTSQVNVD